MTVHTKKSDNFMVIQCPGCANKFKVVRGSAVDLPDACPICQEAAEPSASPADNTIVMNQKTINAMASDLARLNAKVQRIDSDIKGILGVLGREDTSLNEDVPESTKRVPNEPADIATP